MNSNKLWTKLFTRNEEADEIALHISGATTRHRNPFESIEVPRNEEGFAQAFIDKWIIPFYMADFSSGNHHDTIAFANTAKEINIGIVLALLGDFNWRSRITGAYFAAINNYKELDDLIGKHLVKSEVCYAGRGYCLALASFGTTKAIEYLTTYLDYYLTRKDLWFDQSTAFCALKHLDVNKAESLLDKWNSFVVEREYLNHEEEMQRFNNSLITIAEIQKKV